jgi:high-affinity Fe2+/Pb2+ permease
MSSEKNGLAVLVGVLALAWLMVAGMFWSDSASWCRYAGSLSTSSERSEAFGNCDLAESFFKASVAFSIYSMFWLFFSVFNHAEWVKRWGSLGLGIPFVVLVIIGMLYLLGIYLVPPPL